MLDRNDKIYIANHAGLLGFALEKALRGKDFGNLLIKAKEDLDLLDDKSVAEFFQKEKPNHVFLPSYKSGSIQANIKYPAEFIYENLVTQNNVIHNAYLSGVKKLLFVGASCVYPKDSPQPMKEDYLMTGEIEITNQAYSVAKIAGIEMCRAYNKQYGTKFISVIPATLYGPNDHFDLENSHVLSSLIRKFHEAKIKNQSEVILWGSGKPRREFLYSDDLADACVFLMSGNFNVDLVNIGSGEDFEIKELAEKVKNATGFNGKIIWDISKLDGVMKKLLDSSMIKNVGWKHKVDIDDGIKRMYEWFVVNCAKR
ncbi:MAG: GDP-L-fucose synthase [Patescibacteria group bacterium]|nr:GDP-L-fucose synthase [Patescibacteria group bacterium]